MRMRRSAAQGVRRVSEDKRLTWTPPGYPTYSGYTTINISNDGSNRTQTLVDTTDYKINIDDFAVTSGGAITITGGRNVVIIGGRITTSGGPNSSERTGLKIRPRSNAYYHIEGLRIRPDPSVNSGSELHDGIALQRQSGGTDPTSASRLVIQNCRVGPTSIRVGNDDTDHSDIYQVQGIYEGQVWFDRYTGFGDYNGFMLADLVTSQLHRFKRTNVYGVDVHATYQWTYGLYQALRAHPIEILENSLWVQNRAGTTFGAGSGGIYPHNQATGGRGNDGQAQPEDYCTVTTDSSGTYAEWQATAAITGRCYQGIPPAGDWCKDTECGVGYVSPGYL